MATKEEFPLSIVLRTVDRATAGFRKFNENIDRAFKPYREFGKELGKMSDNLGLPRVRSALASVGGEIKRLGVGIAAVGGVAAVLGGRLFKGWVEEGDQLAETAERIGLTATALAGLRYAAKRSNVEAAEFDNALDQLSKRLGQLKAGSGPLNSFLKNTPAAFHKQVKGARGVEEAFSLIANAMKKVGDPTKRAALADAFFGKQGKNLINMLAQGNPELEKLMKRYLEIAGGQERFAKTSSALSDAFDDIGIAMDGVGATIVTAIGPTVEKLALQFAEFMGKNRDRIAKWAEDFAQKLPGMIAQVGPLLDKFKSIWDMIGGAKGALLIFAGVKLAPLVASVVSLTGSLFQMVNAIRAANIASGIGGMVGGIGGGLGKLAPLAAAAGPWALAGLGGAAIGGGIGYVVSRLLGITDADGLKSRSGFVGDDGKFVETPRPSDSKAEAHVTIDMPNMPKGTRVSTDWEGPGAIDFNLGYQMAP